jgi:predicted DCC family thiol-disulfide oxidoreductase YuxK
VQSPVGGELCRCFGIDPADPATMIVVADGGALFESDAALAVAQGLSFPWRAAGLFRIIPRRWRDRFYRLVARNRYRLLGRRETCWTPKPEHRHRIL